MDDWNPMQEEYNDRRINCYRQGVGRDLRGRDQSEYRRMGHGHGTNNSPVSLFVKHLPLEIDEAAVHNIFCKFGKVLNVAIPPLTHRNPSYTTKFGFVTMEAVSGALAAIDNVNGFLLGGKKLVVDIKLSKEETAKRKDWNNLKNLDDNLVKQFRNNNISDTKTISSGDNMQDFPAHPMESYSASKPPSYNNNRVMVDLDYLRNLEKICEVDTHRMNDCCQLDRRGNFLDKNDKFRSRQMTEHDKNMFLHDRECYLNHQVGFPMRCDVLSDDSSIPLQRRLDIKPGIFGPRPDRFRQPCADMYTNELRSHRNDDMLYPQHSFMSQHDFVQENNNRQSFRHNHSFHSVSPSGSRRFHQSHVTMRQGRQSTGQNGAGLHDFDPQNHHGNFSVRRRCENTSNLSNWQGQDRGNCSQGNGHTHRSDVSMDAGFNECKGKKYWCNAGGVTGLNGDKEDTGDELLMEVSQSGRQQNVVAVDAQHRKVQDDLCPRSFSDTKKHATKHTDGFHKHSSSNDSKAGCSPVVRNGQDSLNNKENSNSLQQTQRNKQQQRNRDKSSINDSSITKPEKSSKSMKSSSDGRKLSDNDNSMFLSANVPDDTHHSAMLVLVSHVNNPQSFYVQDSVSGSSAFTDLAASLKNFKTSPVSEVKQGHHVLCEFSDELCRARVMKTFEQHATIFYYDYGNCESTHVSKLKLLPPELTCIPEVAIHCSLPLIPISGQSWPSETVDVLRTLLRDEAADMRYLAEDDALSMVSLTRNSDGLDISQYMIERKLALAAPSKLFKSNGCDRSSTGCRVTSEEEASLFAMTSVMHASRVMADSVPSGAEELCVGKHLETIICHIENTNDLFLLKLDMQESFSQFSKNIDLHCNSMPQLPHIPIEGELVCARYATDGRWYRANVLEVGPERKDALVFFIDYGNKERLPCSDIRIISCEFMSQACYVLHCTVDFDHTAVGEWSPEHMHTYLRCLTAYCLPGDQPHLKVVVMSTQDRVVTVDVINDDIPMMLSQKLKQEFAIHMSSNVVNSDKSDVCSHQSEVGNAKIPVNADMSANAEISSSFAISQTSTIGSSTVSHNAGMLRMPVEESESSVLTENLHCEEEPLLLHMPGSGLVHSNTKPEKSELSLHVLEKCTICGIACCRLFWVTKLSTADSLCSLQDEIEAFFNGDSTGKHEAPGSLRVGDIVLAKDPNDNEWFRAVVDNLSTNGDRCLVFFFDIGCQHELDVSSLRAMPAQFMELPMQAIACALNCSSFPITKKEEDVFSRYLLVDVFCEATKHSDGIWYVDVFPANDCKAPAFFFGKHASVSIEQEECIRRAHVDPSTQCLSAGCQKAIENGKCAAFDSIDKVQVMLQPMNDVYVTYVVDPSKFFGIDKGNFLLQINDLLPVLKLLGGDASMQLSTQPECGEVLCGRFHGEWYRCKVIAVDGTCVEVEFFDYGNTDHIGMSDLRRLPFEVCQKFPVATFCCSLQGVLPRHDEWDSEACILAKTSMEKKLLNLDIKECINGVYLVAARNAATGKDVCQVLLGAGLALRHPDAEMEDLLRQEADSLRQVADLQAKIATYKQ